MKRFFSLLLVATMLLTVFPLGMVASAECILPDEIYLAQETSVTCTLASATMMLRSRMYLSGNDGWRNITESVVRSIAWTSGGLKGGDWDYVDGNNIINVHKQPVSWDMNSELKSVLNNRKEGIVLYCGGGTDNQHAVFVTDYVGDTYYCADPAGAYSGKRIPLADSLLGKRFGSQENILKNVTAYWYIPGYRIEASNPGYLMAHCTKYPCAAVISVTKANNPFTLPCNSNTAAKYGTESIELTSKALSVGDTFVATALYYNSENHYWYETKFSDGTIGYVYADKTEFYNFEIPWVNGGWFYANITGATPLNGTVTTTGTLDYVQAFIYYGTDSHSSVATSSNKVAVNSGTYPLNGSTVDNTLHFEYLSNGYYTLSIEVEFSTYYSEGGELEWTGACARAASYNFTFGNVNTDTTYTISYNANGGWGEPADQTKTKGVDLRLSSQIPSRDGYTFLGWSESSTATYATYEWGDWFTGDYSVTLYAVWEAINDMTLHASADSVYLTLGESETITISVWSEGYYDGPTEVWWEREDAAISCQWGTYSNGVHPLTITANYTGTAIITLSLRDSNTGEWLDSRLLYVYIDALNYTISYNANGGYNAPASQTKEYDITSWISSDIPSRFGYNFLGWSKYSNATYASYQPDEAYYDNSNLTLYAVWEQIPVSTTEYIIETAQIDYPGYGIYYKFTPTVTTSYKIWGLDTVDNNVTVYDVNGNQLAFNDDGYGADYQFELDYSFTAGSTYYIYVKYYSSSNTGDIYFAISRGALISYNANGGSGAPASHYEYCGAAPSLSSTVPTRSGYNFLGWATSSSATSATYQAGDGFTTNANTTLYAVWDKIYDGTNVARNMPYTISGSGVGFGSYTEKLTDGQYSDTISYDDNWFAFYYNSKAESNVINAPDGIGYVIVDLGGTYNLEFIKIHLSNNTQSSISRPHSVNAYLSTDGRTFYSAGTMPLSDVESIAYWSELAVNGSARYVKIEFTLADHFAFIDEIEVYGTENEAGEDPFYPEEDKILGDVNGDGAIDQFDYLLVKRHYFATRCLTDDEMSRADINRDGEINQFDYILIKRHYFGTYTID